MATKKKIVVAENVKKPTRSRSSKKVQEEVEVKSRRPRTNPQVLNHSAGAVVLALGSKNFKPEATVKILLAFNDAEVYIPNVQKFATDRLWRGRNGKGGTPAQLSKDELNQLREIAKQ